MFMPIASAAQVQDCAAVCRAEAKACYRWHCHEPKKTAGIVCERESALN
jgi:hypothetical protein